jgi:hypothetical protein
MQEKSRNQGSALDFGHFELVFDQLGHIYGNVQSLGLTPKTKSAIIIG